MRRRDLVIVGGGIGGSALALVMARAGLDVLVLEKTRAFADENRGELLWPWGVREAQTPSISAILPRAGWSWERTEGHSRVRQQARIELLKGDVELYSAGMLVRSNGIPDALPVSGRWLGAEPAGPCSTFPCSDSWVENPVADGIVLLGDAAGYNNFLIGQGLSLAIRDVAVVSKLLLEDEDWSPQRLEPCASERRGRLEKARCLTLDRMDDPLDPRCAGRTRGRCAPRHEGRSPVTFPGRPLEGVPVRHGRNDGRAVGEARWARARPPGFGRVNERGHRRSSRDVRRKRPHPGGPSRPGLPRARNAPVLGARTARISVGSAHRSAGWAPGPECFGLTETPGREYALWLEDIRESAQRWTLDQYATAARHLGRFNGGYLTGASLPTGPWLCHDFSRAWIVGTRVEPNVAAIRDFPDENRVRRWYPGDMRPALLRLWEERERFLGALAGRPQTLCRFDAFRRNLLIRRTPNGEEQIVFIDWAFMGTGALGEELARWVSATVALFGIEASRIEDSDPWLEQAFGRPVDAILSTSIDLRRYLSRLADEARGLMDDGV